jgi:circadian clock protein KaiB
MTSSAAVATTVAPAETTEDADSAPLFRLYVSAASPVSSRAIVNARNFFDHHLPGQHSLDVIDIASHVDAARADQIIASPTLIRVAPLPRLRFIGDMSDTERLRAALSLKKKA